MIILFHICEDTIYNLGKENFMANYYAEEDEI